MAILLPAACSERTMCLARSSEVLGKYSPGGRMNKRTKRITERCSAPPKWDRGSGREALDLLCVSTSVDYFVILLLSLQKKLIN